MISRVKVWTKQWEKQGLTEVRIYIDYTDANGVFRQGCWYKTGNPYEEARLENLTPEVLEEAKRLAVWDGYWHTLYKEDCERRYAELATAKQQDAQQEEQAPASAPGPGPGSDAGPPDGRWPAFLPRPPAGGGTLAGPRRKLVDCHRRGAGDGGRTTGAGRTRCARPSRTKFLRSSTRRRRNRRTWISCRI
ncbi:MAG: hypothetical protein KatS3mg051_2039 [Anaerolineae bacterium]|nr:MAG: hypothetical protein KatS3mg051_2039 [Anaerolineae bacterium]